MKKKPVVAIQLTNISKMYEIHHERPTLVEKFIKGRNEIFWALRDINLTIENGERVGIIGPNGSGKTTLIKIIAGITTPTSGIVETHGKIVSLIDLEAGFHPDLTGEQNIFINGILLGMENGEIKQKISRIIAFADIGQFIDAPLFTYSSGMKLRLGFAIAIHAEPDILILDEGLSVGDAAFHTKAGPAIRRLMCSDTTVLYVSHSFAGLKYYCKRFCLLTSGKLAQDGGTEVLTSYKSISYL